jgi:hypothetical protein
LLPEHDRVLVLLAVLACAAYPSFATGAPVADDVAVGTAAGPPTRSVGDTSSNTATVTVTVSAPEPTMPADETVGVGETYIATVSEVVTGASADWGDGTPAEVLTVSADRTATLAHVFQHEGSFTLTVTNAPGVAGTSFVHVLVAGSSATASEAVEPGETGTLTLPGLTATLERPAGDGGGATMVGALYPPTVSGFFVGGAFGDPVAAFDVRVLAAGDADVLTVTFGYPEPAPRARPVLTYFSPQTNTFEPVAGSKAISPSLTIDPAAHLITVVFDNSSTPRLTALTGTRLVVSDRSVPRVIEVAAPSTTRAGAKVRVLTGLAAYCPADGPPCTVATRAHASFTPAVAPLRMPGLVIGKRRMRCRPGKRADLTLVLGPKSRRVLQQLGELPLTVEIRARVAGHPPATVMRTLTISAP